MIFITGASRSGTTLLSFVLRNHRPCSGCKELQYFGQAWDPRDTHRRFTAREAIEAAPTCLPARNTAYWPRHGPRPSPRSSRHRDALGAAGPTRRNCLRSSPIGWQVGRQADSMRADAPLHFLRARDCWRYILPRSRPYRKGSTRRDGFAEDALATATTRGDRPGGAALRNPACLGQLPPVYHGPAVVARTAVALALAEHPRVTLFGSKTCCASPKRPCGSSAPGWVSTTTHRPARRRPGQFFVPDRRRRCAHWTVRRRHRQVARRALRDGSRHHGTVLRTAHAPVRL